jgi:hypothetical protein
MSQQPSGPAGPGNDEWPDYLWPDDEEGAPGVAWPGLPPPPGGPPRRRFRPAVLGTVIVVAALAGAGVALAAQVFSGRPHGPATANSRPPVLSPAQPGGNGQPGTRIGGNGQPGSQIGGNGVPGGAGVSGGQIFIVGRVSAVSGNSITIGGPARTVPASVTGATRITGKVTSISGIKVGDQVSAQISQQGSGLTVVAIQYPAQTP